MFSTVLLVPFRAFFFSALEEKIGICWNEGGTGGHPLMIYAPFAEAYTGSCYTAVSPQTVLGPLQIYNESRYGTLNNLDYRHDIGVFPRQAHSASVNTLALDGLSNRFLLSGSSDSSIKLWDLQSASMEGIDTQRKFKPSVTLPRKSVHSFGVTRVRWWPDNGMWLSSSYDFKLNLYDSSTMGVAHSFKLGSRVLDFDFHPLGDISTVACCLDGGVGGLKLVDLRTLSDTQNLGGGGKAVGGVGYMSSCCWSPASPYLCIGGGLEGSCYGWDIRSSNKFLLELDVNLTATSYKRKQSNKRKRDLKLKCKAHHGSINSMLFNASGTELVTLGNDEKLRVWDMCSFRKPINKAVNFGPLIRNKTRQHIEICLSPAPETEVSFLWVPSDNGEVLVYRVEDGSLVARLNKATNRLGQNRSYSIVCSGHNQVRYFSGCKDGSISVWGHDDLKQKQQQTVPVPFDNGVDLVEPE